MEELTCKKLTVSRDLTYRYYVSQSKNDASSLLLLHGWPDDAHLFARMLPSLQSLGRQIIIPDLLGYGGTAKPTAPSLYSMREMGEDLREILDAEGIAKVIVIGHDWGSGLASRFSLFHTNRCAALPGAPEIWEQHLDAAWTALHGASPVEGPQKWMTELFCNRGAMREFLLSGGRTPSPPPLRDYALDPGLRAHWIEALNLGGMRAPACWYHALVSNLHWEGEENWAEEVKAQRAEDESSWKLNLPVLFIGCNGDAISSTEMQRMAVQQGLLPDLRIEGIESGHWCPYEKPDEVAKIIVDFIQARYL